MFDTKHTVFTGYGCEDVDPRGFVSLMDMYENNYLRLRRLIPDLDKLPDNAISRMPGCLNLYLSVLERTEFTTTLYLTYYFQDDNKRIAEPALTIRVYHDANQAEVLTGNLQHGREQHDHIPSKTKKIKWKFNRFLYKWLGYCLHLGHSFTSADSVHARTDYISDFNPRGLTLITDPDI
jgi:uncharacterized protein YqiB (DUF1249 family)